ncbi:MAG: TIGR02757 family protein [Bacteroidetes bacterium]|nr:TIGR02757 family protein [Bacteroidota bacterium]
MVEKYNHTSFIPNDPVSIPHRFTKKQDIEIAALFSALLAWGQRTTILKNLNTLMHGMENAPYDFVLNHKPKDRKRFEHFVHRTFQYGDLVYFLEFLQQHYRSSDSMEVLFSGGMKKTDAHVGNGLIHFHRQFFSLPHLNRTEKHVSTPERKSACKRMNLFLRWMVRYDDKGVDFGIWKQIQPKQLLCPLDIHVQKAATSLGILKRTQADWNSVLELTGELKKLDPDDPVKYDFALFGYSLENKL